MSTVRRTVRSNMKSAVALLLSVLLIATMAAFPRSASAATQYGINISNSTSGYTYTAYKVFDATYSADNDGDGEPDSVAYTIASSSPYYSAVSNSGLFTLNKIGNTDTYSVVFDATKSELVSWLQNLGIPSGASAAGSVVGDGQTVFIDLAESGFYYVTSELGGVVTLTTNTPQATVIDKNQTPGFDDGEGKFVYDEETDSYLDYTDASIGDSVDFKFTASVPMYDKKDTVSTYVFTDTLPEGITLDDADSLADFIANNLSVSFVGTVNTIQNQTIASYNMAGGSIVASNAINYDVELITSGGTVTGFKVIVYVEDSTSVYPTNNDTTITIEYSATLNSEAAFENTNVMEMDWTFTDDSEDNPGGEDDEDVKDTSTVYVYGFNLIKRADTTTGLQLEDAKFMLYNEAGETAYFLDDGNGLYTFVGFGSTGAAVSGTTQTLVAGSVQIFGLEADTYYLEEEEAPAGYLPLTEKQAVVINDTAPSSTDAYETTAIVVNSSGKLLPSTGGIGTVVLTVAGIALIAGAASVLVIRRRKNAGGKHGVDA